MAQSKRRKRFERYREQSPAELLRNHLFGLAAVAVAVFGYWIRLVPRDGMEYMQALDPYVISRMSEAIVTEGALPMMDAWRYFPWIMPVFKMNLGNIYVPAYAYKIIGPVTGMSFVSWTQVYPAILGALMVAVMYFIGKELFDRQAGLFAAFFLAASPAILHRSSAGWFEKEPIGSLLMFVSIYFVVRAWKRASWPSGILSGIALGIAVTSWGGTRFLVLLYPLVMVFAALLDDDIDGMIAAFTPTILIGHVLAATLNPSRWNVMNGPMLASLGVLLALWIRYIGIEYDLIDEKYKGQIIPGVYALGGLFLLLSPLYSQRIARMAMGIIQQAAQETQFVVAGTVAENAPAQAGQIIGQLGVSRLQAFQPLSGFYGQYGFPELFSGWTMAIIGTSVLLMMLQYMLWRRYPLLLKIETLGVLDKDDLNGVPAGYAYFGFIATTIAFSAFVLWLLPGSAGQAFIHALGIAVVGGAFMWLFGSRETLAIPQQWYLLIPLFWILATLYGATTKSRLLFLTSHPVALMAGFGLSTAFHQLRDVNLWEQVEEKSEELDAERIVPAVLLLLLVPVILFNAGAAYTMAQSIGGSPNQAWMENLDHMREETPKDSVVLSWWDYGYWFETIGGRAAIADGGNAKFYSHAPGFNDTIINMPLADFLTAEDYTQHLDWLDAYSVDYVVLDSTMIGKYSAVSQIHNRDNSQFDAMQTFQCQGQGNQCAIQQANGGQYLVYNAQGARIVVPVQQQGNGIGLAGQPMFQQQGGTAPIANFCSPQGVIEFNQSEQQQQVPGCVAWHPYYQQQRLIYIPEPVMDSTLVNLYVMDAHNMPHFDEVFNNGYVKMWKVNYDAEGSQDEAAEQ